MSRKNFSSGSPWEPVVGYSRAVRTGNTIEVSGTVAVDQNGETVGKDDPYVQTHYVLEKIGKVLEEEGAGLNHVVRTRIYCTDIRQWEAIGKAHGEYFSSVLPATSMVQVAALIGKDYLVEIEATAIVC
jgi:reactive intermediate/imine deaminase